MKTHYTIMLAYSFVFSYSINIFAIHFIHYGTEDFGIQTTIKLINYIMDHPIEITIKEGEKTLIDNQEVQPMANVQLTLNNEKAPEIFIASKTLNIAQTKLILPKPYGNNTTHRYSIVSDGKLFIAQEL